MYLGAWLDLSTCRDIGFGEGPIPWNDAEAYGASLGLDEEEMFDFHYHIRALDTMYFKHRSKKKPGDGS